LYDASLWSLSLCAVVVALVTVKMPGGDSQQTAATREF